PLSNGQAVFTTDALAVGPHVVTEAYSGDGNFHSSTSEGVLEVVTKADSATIVVASAGASLFGQAVTFTAAVDAVAPGAGTPTGWVTFTIDGLAQPSIALSNGQASVTIAELSVGNHSISVAYSGDDNFNAGTPAGLSQTVNDTVAQTRTSTVLVSSANPALFGQTLTFTATISIGDPSAGTPTGTVQFQIDGNDAGSPVSVSTSGDVSSASFSASSLAVGRDTVTSGLRWSDS